MSEQPPPYAPTDEKMMGGPPAPGELVLSGYIFPGGGPHVLPGWVVFSPSPIDVNIIIKHGAWVVFWVPSLSLIIISFLYKLLSMPPVYLSASFAHPH